MEARQLWSNGKPTATVATTTTYSVPYCTPFTLPANGFLTLADDSIITLTADAVFEPACTQDPNDIIVTSELSGGGSSSVTDFRDPFYASTLPQCYALAATTVIAYMLFIMLLITPRTFLHQGAIVLGRRGFTNGPSGSDAGIGIGGRPWLQKVAALTVAISLSIATADTFKVAEQQYNSGIMDASDLQKQVDDGLELKIIRLISDTFLWLAQAQTLIRLFPRQREKIIIKWTAFALITLDVLFSILNVFVYRNASRPRSFVDAVPALTYLFQLTLSLLYCAWVMYYSLTKRSVAFYHPQMRNICLVAFLSLISVLIPVVFFVLDVSKPSLAAWGDYVRWVGAAAASVVVWEWVERIECLERNDKKDGILGREVFDGDEMLDPNPDPDSNGKRQRKRSNTHKDDDSGDTDSGSKGGGVTTSRHGISWPAVSGIANRYRHRTAHRDVEAATDGPEPAHQNTTKRKLKPLPTLWPTRPDPVATPVSRTDTASAESTVYAVRYHPISEGTPRPVVRNNSLEITRTQTIDGDSDEFEKDKIVEHLEVEDGSTAGGKQQNPWQAFMKATPFHRKMQQPPPEVSAYRVKPTEIVNSHGAIARWDVRSKIEEFAATQAEKIRDKTRPPTTAAPLSVTVIPAPVRRRNLGAMLEEIEEAEREHSLHHISGPADAVPATRSDEPSSPRHSQPSRSTEDPYTPSDLARHSIAQRGAISFITALPQDHRPANVASASPPPPAESLNITPVTSRSLVAQSRSPTYSELLPVHSIPAPPRRPRTDDD